MVLVILCGLFNYIVLYDIKSSLLDIERTCRALMSNHLYNAPFISCISKINSKLVENAEDLDIVIPMYNMLKYSKNYEKTSGMNRDEPKYHEPKEMNQQR